MCRFFLVEIFLWFMRMYTLHSPDKELLQLNIFLAIVFVNFAKIEKLHNLKLR